MLCSSKAFQCLCSAVNSQGQDAKERLEVVDGIFLCLYFIMFMKISSFLSVEVKKSPSGLQEVVLVFFPCKFENLAVISCSSSESHCGIRVTTGKCSWFGC